MNADSRASAARYVNPPQLHSLFPFPIHCYNTNPHTTPHTHFYTQATSNTSAEQYHTSIVARANCYSQITVLHFDSFNLCIIASVKRSTYKGSKLLYCSAFTCLMQHTHMHTNKIHIHTHFHMWSFTHMYAKFNYAYGIWYKALKVTKTCLYELAIIFTTSNCFFD